MSSKWKDGALVGSLLDRMLKYVKLTEKGDISYVIGSPFEEDLWVLQSLTRFHDDVPQADRYKIIHGAFISSGKLGKINQGVIAEEIKKREKQYLSLPTRDFVLLTSCSMQYTGVLRSARIRGNFLQFLKSKPISFDTSVADKQIIKLLRGPMPSDYTFVKIFTKGRCEYSAANSALDSFDLLRGIWNLHHHLRLRRFLVGQPMPINPIVIGPQHTIHERSGKSASSIFWWEPSYTQPVRLHEVGKSIANLKSFEKDIRKRLAMCKLSGFIEDGIIRYTRALDESNMSSAFLRLWNVLEHLTITDKKDSFETTIKRALFVWGNQDYHKLVLNSLRMERNKLVHSGSESPRGEYVVHLLMPFINELLILLIRRAHWFKDRSDVIELLELPPNHSALVDINRSLENKIKNNRRAIKLFTKK